MDIFGDFVNDDRLDERLPAATPGAPSMTIKTLADLMAFVEAAPDIPRDERRRTVQRIERCIEIIGRNISMEHTPASSLSCDIEWLNSVLFKLPPKAHGIVRATFTSWPFRHMRAESAAKESV